MIRVRIAWTSLLLAGLAGCSATQNRLTSNAAKQPAGSSDPFMASKSSSPPAGMGRFFPSLPGRKAEIAARTPAEPPASKPPGSRASTATPPRPESLAKAAPEPARTEKKVFAPIAWIESRWAARVKAARASSLSTTAPRPTPTTASVRKKPEPEMLPRSIAVAVYPDDESATNPAPSASRGSSPSPMPKPPAIDPTAEASSGSRDDDAHRARVETSDDPVAIVDSPVEASKTPSSSSDSADRVETPAESPAPSAVVAPEPPRLPPVEAVSVPDPLAGRPRLAAIPAAVPIAHVTPRPRPAVAPAPRTVQLPQLGLPADLPPVQFLRSYYGLDPSPKPALLPTSTSTVPASANPPASRVALAPKAELPRTSWRTWIDQTWPRTVGEG